MKKMRSILFAVTLIVSISLMSSIAVFAAEPTDHFEPPETMEACLISDSGERSTVVGRLVGTSTSRSSSDMKSATYEYILYNNIVQRTLTASGTDSSRAMRAYCIIYYNQRTVNGTTEYLLTNVSGNWTMLDSSVSLNRATVDYFCHRDGIGNQRVYGRALTSNVFSINTGFSNYITPYMGVLGARLNFELQMGSSRKWEFILDNFYFVEGGWSPASPDWSPAAT